VRKERPAEEEEKGEGKIYSLSAFRFLGERGLRGLKRGKKKEEVRSPSSSLS